MVNKLFIHPKFDIPVFWPTCFLLSPPEGGQLEQEIRYTESSLGESNANTHQLVIQTPHRENANILTANAMLSHLEVLKEAIDVEVNVFDM